MQRKLKRNCKTKVYLLFFGKPNFLKSPKSLFHWSVVFLAKNLLIVLQSLVLFSKFHRVIEVLSPVRVELAWVSSILLCEQDWAFDSCVSLYGLWIVDVIITISVDHQAGSFNLFEWDLDFVVFHIHEVSVPAFWPKGTDGYENWQAWFHMLYIWVVNLQFSNFISLFLSSSTFLLVVSRHEIPCYNSLKHTCRSLACVIGNQMRVIRTSSFISFEHLQQRMFITSWSGTEEVKRCNSVWMLKSQVIGNHTTAGSSQNWHLVNFKEIHQCNDEISLCIWFL